MREWTNLGQIAELLLSKPTEAWKGLDVEAHPWEAIGKLLAIAVAGFAVHGLVLGARSGWRQALASAVKLPAVPLFSLALTAPLLHAICLTAGQSAPFSNTVALAMIPLAVTALLLLATAPLIAFFTATSDYDFVKVLNVGAAAIFGLYGANALRVTLGSSGSPIVYLLWLGAFFFVAAQMAWTLRPFLGSPDLPFAWRRTDPCAMNFYTALLHSADRLLLPRESSVILSEQVHGEAPRGEPENASS